MIQIQDKNADLFACGAQALVNPTNTHNGGIGVPHGYMGAGLALVFANRFHGLAQAYYEVCKYGGYMPGNVHVWLNPEYHPEQNLTQYVINFPTKLKMTSPSQLAYIKDSLGAMGKAIKKHKITSIGMPALGCGFGQLKFCDVLPVITAWSEEQSPDLLVKLFPPK